MSSAETFDEPSIKSSFRIPRAAIVRIVGQEGRAVASKKVLDRHR